MKVLVVGSGGREHAIVRALTRSRQRPELICSPGNPGIAADARLLPHAADDVDALVAAAKDEAVDFVVVGPEVPLVAGIVDALAAEDVAAFGPTRAAAALEGSKEFAKQAMHAAGVPTAAWARARTVDEGLAAIRSYPTVLKADGLAAGKGVVIASDEAHARATLEAFLIEHQFATETVLIEEHLEGPELSLLALCDGERAIAMAPARDYKRIFDGDRGPNTGGMGSYSPVAGLDSSDIHHLVKTIHQPIVDYMRERGTPFRGVLYGGLMLTADGPRVIEFNVRFGDPETQALLPRLRTDLLDALLRTTHPDGLRDFALDWSPQWSVSVALASAGYPQSATLGDAITGLDSVPADIEVTHAGTAERDGAIVTNGGRVLNVTALGADAQSARAAAYAAAKMIDFTGKQFRTDIAADAAKASR
jgi:phosphoribosylamine--glycine ligase